MGKFLSTAQKHNMQTFEHNRPGPRDIIWIEYVTKDINVYVCVYVCVCLFALVYVLVCIR